MPYLTDIIKGTRSAPKKEKPYISRPIHFNTQANTVYRWDSRPPEVIEREGFSGSPKSFFNMIFGKKTVFSANDIQGSRFYFNELEAGMSQHGESETYYLYEIYTSDIPSTPLYGNEKKSGFITALATREPGMNQYKNKDPELDKVMKEYGLPPITFYNNAERYIRDTASKNHEVQLCGPIPPSKIRYLGKRTLSDEAKKLRRQLITKRQEQHS